MAMGKQQSAMQALSGLSQHGRSRSTTYPSEDDPEKSIGGAIAAGAGGAAGGAAIGSYSANPYGVAIGAAAGFVVGAASYYLS